MPIDNSVIRGPDICGSIPEQSLGIQIYEAFLKRLPGEIAFHNAITEEQLSYDQFFELTRNLAHVLGNLGYKFGDVLAISSENSNTFFVPVVAALYLGMVSAPFNHTYTEDELLHVVNITKPKIVFCSYAVLSKFIKLKQKVTYIERIVVIDSNADIEGFPSLKNFIKAHLGSTDDVSKFQPVHVNPFDDLAVVLCSSGTTGLPKGVMTTHDNISMKINHNNDSRVYSVRSEIVLGVLPFFHGYGFMTGLATLIKRSTTVVLTKFEERLFLSCIEKYKVSNLYLVPPLMLFLARSPLLSEYNLSSLKDIGCGAAPLSKSLEEEVAKRLPNLVIRQGYGLTECTLGVIIMPVGENRPGSSGKVVPGMSCKIRDPETGKTLGTNQVGELCFKGRMVMKGYYGNSKVTKESFTDDGWLLTGDLAYYDEDGYFFIVDRLKELIKYKGFQVAPAELEAILLTHPDVADAGVVGVPDDDAGEVAKAFIVLKPNVTTSCEEIRSYVAKRVSKPKQLHGGVKFVQNIPKNPSGKILRRQLRKMANTLDSKL